MSEKTLDELLDKLAENKADPAEVAVKTDEAAREFIKEIRGEE